VGWEFVAIPIFASLLSYLQLMGLKSLFLYYYIQMINELIIHHYDEALAVWGVENENEKPTIPQF
jgi:hypothetical protein